MFQQTLQSTGTTIGTASIAQKGIFSHALNVRQENHTTWIVDSGASDHMTGNLMVFHEYTPCHNNSSVRIADGTLSRVFGTGSVIISKDITLHSVFYVPKLDCNLLSINLKTSTTWFRRSFRQKFKSIGQIMLENAITTFLGHIFWRMASYIKAHALILHSKMELQKGKIDI